MRPALLVHGYLATPTVMTPMRDRLRDAGVDARLVPELSPLVMGDVYGHAEQLGRAVDRVCAETGCETVDLVGASQGGIIALAWAGQTDWARVGRMVAVGTPFRGAPVARWARWLLGPVSKGIRQLVPNSELTAQLAAMPLRRPVHAVSLRGDPVCPPSVCALPGMTTTVIDGSFGPLSHQLLMLDRRAIRAIVGALTC